MLHDKKHVLDTQTYSFLTRITGFRDKALPVWGKHLFAPVAVWKDDRGKIDWSTTLGFGHILDSGDDPLLRYVCVGFVCLHNGGAQARKYILLHVTVTSKGEKELTEKRLNSYHLFPFRLFDLKGVVDEETGLPPPAVGSVGLAEGKTNAISKSGEQFFSQVAALFNVGGYLHSEYVFSMIEVFL
jgi:hypothetical protein